MNYKEETIELISKEISICEKNNCTHSQVEFSLDQLYMINKALEAKEPEVVTKQELMTLAMMKDTVERTNVEKRTGVINRIIRRYPNGIIIKGDE